MSCNEPCDIRIFGMAVCTPPQKLGGDVELLATFSVFVWPIRATNLRLIRQKGEVKLWLPTRDVRFLSDARPMIIEAAMKTARDAYSDLGALVE